jgi:valacyclovir hydrolase
MTSGKVDLNGWPVWYEKFGTGSEVVLLIPGAMGMSDVINLKICHKYRSIGTGRSDFKPQLEGPNAFDLKKYTFIAIELPGWGRSRPPKRPYGINVYHNDADVAIKLMDV